MFPSFKGIHYWEPKHWRLVTLILFSRKYKIKHIFICIIGHDFDIFGFHLATWGVRGEGQPRAWILSADGLSTCPRALPCSEQRNFIEGEEDGDEDAHPGGGYCVPMLQRALQEQLEEAGKDAHKRAYKDTCNEAQKNASKEGQKQASKEA